MNKIRELTKEDWIRFEEALDNLLRCKLGQFGVPFAKFWIEFSGRIDEVVPEDISQGEKENLKTTVKRVLEKSRDAIALTAFGSSNVSFGVKSLDDLYRELGIQATLRRCNYSDDLSKCPVYPTNCCAPLTGFCPKK
jgi:hypothetical protein